MPMSRVVALLLTVVCLGLAACGSVPPTHYYSLGKIIPAAPAAARSTLSAGVEDFTAEGLYARDNFLYRQGGYEILPDYYRRWSLPPHKLLADLTTDYVRSLGLFREVYRLPYLGKVDRVLQGRVLRFEELSPASGAGPQVRVELEFSLYDPAARQRLWRVETASSAELPLQHSADQVAAATEKAVGDCLSQAMRALGGYLSSPDATGK